MSTNKTLKRVALVAVASLGFGLVSVAPSNAADVAITAGKVTAVTLATVTSAPTAGTAVDVNFGVATAATAAAATDKSTARFVGVVTSYPAGAFAQVTASKTAAGTDTLITGEVDASAVIADNVLTAKGADNTAFGGNTVTASATAGVGKFSFTPSAAGTYVLTVWHDADAGSDIDINETQNQISITVVAAAAAAALSQAYSTVYAVAGNGVAAATSATDATGITAARAVATANAGALTISANNTSNSPITTVTVAASISGVGLIQVGTLTDDAPSANICNSGGVRNVAATAADAVNTLYVCSDGSAGVGTITVTITDTVSGAVATFTKTVTFYGAVASYKATAKKVIVGASAPSNGTQTTAAVEVIAYDSAGVIVPGQSAYFTSSDTTKIAGAAAITTSTAAQAAAGTATVALTVADSATADRYGKVTLTIQPSSTVTTPSTTVEVTLAKVAADAYTITTDKASYTVGEKITFTLTRTDAGRTPATAATAASLSWTANRTYTGTMATDIAATTTGVDTWSIFAPVTPGDFTLTGTLAATAAWATALQTTTWTRTLSIAQDSVSAATTNAAIAAADAAADAAAEAIDAANAATDAANLAAEAADAATVAAEEARDAADAATAAVEELATQVATLMAALKAQITTLANTVAKIAKKIKA